MRNYQPSRRGWTRGQVLLAFLILTSAIACGLAVYSSATTFIGVTRTAFSVLFLPLLLSLVLAFLLEPPVAKLSNYFNRTSSIFIVYLLVLGIFLASTLWLLPQWQELWGNLITDIPRYTARLTEFLRQLLENLHNRFPVIESYNLPTKVRGWGEQLLAAILASTPQSAMKVGSLFVIVPLFTFLFPA